jgi:putative adhesin
MRSPSRLLPRAAVIAAVALALLGPAPPLRADENDPSIERFEKAYELDGIEKVRVQNVNGPVKVSGWEKPYLRVSAVKKAKGGRKAETLRDTEIRISKRGSEIDIETILPKRGRLFGIFDWGGDRGAEVSYELLLPPGVGVDVETVNGRVIAEKRSGSLSLNTVNGSVRVENQTGPLKVNTVNGSVEVAFTGQFRPSNLETVNGSVTVSCAKDSSIRYELQTVNGRIESEFADLAVKGKWGPKEARGEINGGRERLAVETVNGEVRLLAEK